MKVSKKELIYNTIINKILINYSNKLLNEIKLSKKANKNHLKTDIQFKCFLLLFLCKKYKQKLFWGFY